MLNSDIYYSEVIAYMAYDVLIDAVQGLSEESVMDVIKYIDFVKYKSNVTGVSEKDNIKKKRTIGTMKGKIHMAEDFDDIPEGFKEYMQ